MQDNDHDEILVSSNLMKDQFIIKDLIYFFSKGIRCDFRLILRTKFANQIPQSEWFQRSSVKIIGQQPIRLQSTHFG